MVVTDKRVLFGARRRFRVKTTAIELGTLEEVRVRKHKTNYLVLELVGAKSVSEVLLGRRVHDRERIFRLIASLAREGHTNEAT